MKTNIVIDISPPNTISGKILFLKLRAKMLFTNQISGFCTMRYFKKEADNEVYFWHKDKHQSFLEGNTIILGVYSQACPKYAK